MSSTEATFSMLEVMPEELRVKVFEFTQKLFHTACPASPYSELTAAQILSDLEESRSQIARGEGLNMEEALHQLEKKHGFV